MKIFLTGGTGFIGRSLTELLVQEGHSVQIITRNPGKTARFHQGVAFIQGNPTAVGPWQEKLKDCDAVFNLAGASIFERWTKANKQKILDSRVLTTRNIVDALSQRRQRETHLLNASAIGYYGYHQDERLDESAPPGADFLASVSERWEAEALKAEEVGVRVVLCRFGIVLGRKGGALGKLLPVFKAGLGSRLGSGRQWFSWIHERDLVNILLHLLLDKDSKGPVNCTTPYPVRNSEMTKILGAVLKRPTVLPPVPGFVLKMMLGEFAESLLRGQRIVPAKLEAQNFPLRFPDIQKAFENLLLD
ncbi:MAG: TIGR01777 family oxidoreductase [Candidatus Aminicenantes bacterium]|jgi:uncharacterized protein (TIGR01777 family)